MEIAGIRNEMTIPFPMTDGNGGSPSSLSLARDTVTLSGQHMLTDEEGMEALASSQAMIAENPLAALGAHSLMPSRVYSLLNL